MCCCSVQLHPCLFCSPSLSNALQHSGRIDQPVSQLTVSLPISLYGLVTSMNLLSHQLTTVGYSLHDTVVFVQSRAARSLPSKCHFVNSFQCITGMDYYNFNEDNLINFHTQQLLIMIDVFHSILLVLYQKDIALAKCSGIHYC